MQRMIQAVGGGGSWTDPDFPPTNASLFCGEVSAEEVAAIAQGKQ